jgi:hypothetical protein
MIRATNLCSQQRTGIMTDTTETTDNISPGFRDNYTAPIVYFDGSATHGVVNGTIQIEVISRILIPLEDGGVKVEFLTTGRLRCSSAAAKSLIESLQKCLEMIDLPQPKPAVGTGTLN